VGNIPGVNHQQAIRAFGRAGFWIVRQSGHVVMSNGSRIITIPRANPINGYTLGGIVRDAGLSEEEFRKLL
jgi:predicted RNA binding protein YcfA (HicA-like mRNA interferase family)